MQGPKILKRFTKRSDVALPRPPTVQACIDENEPKSHAILNTTISRGLIERLRIWFVVECSPIGGRRLYNDVMEEPFRFSAQHEQQCIRRWRH